VQFAGTRVVLAVGKTHMGKPDLAVVTSLSGRYLVCHGTVQPLCIMNHGIIVGMHVSLDKSPEVGKWLGKSGCRINNYLFTYTLYFTPLWTAGTSLSTQSTVLLLTAKLTTFTTRGQSNLAKVALNQPLCQVPAQSNVSWASKESVFTPNKTSMSSAVFLQESTRD